MGPPPMNPDFDLKIRIILAFGGQKGVKMAPFWGGPPGGPPGGSPEKFFLGAPRGGPLGGS